MSLKLTKLGTYLTNYESTSKSLICLGFLLQMEKVNFMMNGARCNWLSNCLVKNSDHTDFIDTINAIHCFRPKFLSALFRLMKCCHIKVERKYLEVQITPLFLPNFQNIINKQPKVTRPSIQGPFVTETVNILHFPLI